MRQLTTLERRQRRYECTDHAGGDTIPPLGIVGSFPFDEPVSGEGCPVRADTQSTLCEAGGKRG